VSIPERLVDTQSLLALADLTIGAGGTMNRESALLGTPTYSVFAGRLAAVDAELMRMGRLHDMRVRDVPSFEKKATIKAAPIRERSDKLLGRVLHALQESL
jgi:predicted glycosyltransferase